MADFLGVGSDSPSDLHPIAFWRLSLGSAFTLCQGQSPCSPEQVTYHPVWLDHNMGPMP